MQSPIICSGLTNLVIRAVDLGIVSVQSQGVRGRGALLAIYRDVEKHAGVMNFHVGGTLLGVSLINHFLLTNHSGGTSRRAYKG